MWPWYALKIEKSKIIFTIDLDTNNRQCLLQHSSNISYYNFIKMNINFLFYKLLYILVLKREGLSILYIFGFKTLSAGVYLSAYHPYLQPHFLVLLLKAPRVRSLKLTNFNCLLAPLNPC